MNTLNLLNRGLKYIPCLNEIDLRYLLNEFYLSLYDLNKKSFFLFKKNSKNDSNNINKKTNNNKNVSIINYINSLYDKKNYNFPIMKSTIEFRKSFLISFFDQINIHEKKFYFSKSN